MNKSGIHLVIDTASEYLFLALIINAEVADSIYEYGHQNHSVTILPSIEKMLQKAGISLQEVTQVIVGIGPGSYTGVRIGVSIAKMIGYLNNIPVKTISSLALLASSSNATYIIPSIDARRGNSFIAYFSRNEKGLKYLLEDSLSNTENYLKDIHTDYDFVQNGKPDISKIMHSGLLKNVNNVHDLIPNYLQITEAERNLQQS